MLDVGCGWGSFAIHAAKHHGVRRARRHPVRAPGRARAASASPPPGVADSSSCASPTTASWPASSSTRSRASAWSSTWGRSGSTCTCQTLHDLLRPGGRLLNHGIAKLDGLRHQGRGRVLRALRVPRRRAAPAVADRAGAGAHRPGHPARRGPARGLRARPCGYWIESYEDRYDEAVALAGAERARVWRLYLRAARQGFTTGWASVYQVLASRQDENGWTPSSMQPLYQRTPAGVAPRPSGRGCGPAARRWPGRRGPGAWPAVPTCALPGWRPARSVDVRELCAEPISLAPSRSHSAPS